MAVGHNQRPVACAATVIGDHIPSCCRIISRRPVSRRFARQHPGTKTDVGLDAKMLRITFEVVGNLRMMRKFRIVLGYGKVRVLHTGLGSVMCSERYALDMPLVLP